eukprot:SAG22_NODE_621_length_8504_cov_3.476859_5_plen_198_part_00
MCRCQSLNRALLRSHVRLTRPYAAHANQRAGLDPPVEQDRMGPMVAEYTKDHRVRPATEFWRLAEEVRAETVSSLRHGSAARKEMAVLPWLLRTSGAAAFSAEMAKMVEAAEQTHPLGRKKTLEVTNLGRSGLQPTYGPDHELTNFWWAGDAVGSDSTLFMRVLSLGAPPPAPKTTASTILQQQNLILYCVWPSPFQ